MRAVLTWWSAAVFVVLWSGFVIAIIGDADHIESVDDWFQRQPTAARLVLWVLFLPIAIGARTWTSSSAAIRWCGVAALVMWTAASLTSLVRLLSE